MAVSSRTAKALATDPDLDKGLYKKNGNGVQKSQPLGKDPTRRVTQGEYNTMLAKQKKEQATAYQKYKTKKK